MATHINFQVAALMAVYTQSRQTLETEDAVRAMPNEKALERMHENNRRRLTRLLSIAGRALDEDEHAHGVVELRKDLHAEGFPC